MVFEFQGNSYPVEVIRKPRNKNSYLRVREDFTLSISTNRFTSDRAILKMMEENRSSIEKMYEKQIKKKEATDGFFYLGKRYDVVLCSGGQIELGEARVFLGKDASLEKWYKEQAKTLFLERLDFCYHHFTRNIPYPKLRLRWMKTRWGVCNYRDHVVTLNLELMKKPLACLDYVIYHELSHLVEPNHSSSFWKVVEENDPDYKKWRRFLKTN